MYKCDIVVVGCGGTGSHYIKELGRFLRSNNGIIFSDLRLILIDGDQVEEKNLERQAFLKEDIGRNKAEVMAEILGEVYEIDCCYYDHFIDYYVELEKFVRDETIVVLVGCVDNHQCRQSLHYFFIEQENCVYLDAANEYAVGEVVIGSRLAGLEVYPDRTKYFPDILCSKEKKRSEESCEVLNASNPQHLLTNQYAAMILLTNTVKFLTGEWIGGIIFFNSMQCFIQDRTEKMNKFERIEG